MPWYASATRTAYSASVWSASATRRPTPISFRSLVFFEFGDDGDLAVVIDEAEPRRHLVGRLLEEIAEAEPEATPASSWPAARATSARLPA